MMLLCVCRLRTSRCLGEGLGWQQKGPVSRQQRKAPALPATVYAGSPTHTCYTHTHSILAVLRCRVGLHLQTSRVVSTFTASLPGGEHGSSPSPAPVFPGRSRQHVSATGSWSRDYYPTDHVKPSQPGITNSTQRASNRFTEEKLQASPV